MSSYHVSWFVIDALIAAVLWFSFGHSIYFKRFRWTPVFLALGSLYSMFAFLAYLQVKA